MLERGKIDLIIAPDSLAEHSEGLTTHPLTNDRVGILCRNGHRLSGKKEITTRDLESESWLAHSRGSLLRQQTEAAMVASGVRQIQIVCETDSIRSALEIVVATEQISTMLMETTKPCLEDRLTFLPFEHRQRSRTASAIHLVGISLNPITEKILQVLKSRPI